ncbi:hypothetical protein C6Y62_12535 [Hyphomicrobium sulfonivorans]|nr:hypothetical protein [Hyphomicrobium sulfonivorans]
MCCVAVYGVRGAGAGDGVVGTVMVLFGAGVVTLAPGSTVTVVVSRWDAKYIVSNANRTAAATIMASVLTLESSCEWVSRRSGRSYKAMANLQLVCTSNRWRDERFRLIYSREFEQKSPR